jgi:hypothetical protein
MPSTSRRVLAMPAIVAVAGFTATGPAADALSTATAATPPGVHAHPNHRGQWSRGDRADHGAPVVRSSGPLSDLQPAVAGPFDGASAAVRIIATQHGSHTVLQVRGVEGAEGQTYGAHLHSGPCIAGQPAAALGHYNTDVLAGVVPPAINDRTEIWLDFTVEDGSGAATASVPFVPQPGTRSVVVHAAETDPLTGTAGARLACLPVEW